MGWSGRAPAVSDGSWQGAPNTRSTSCPSRSMPELSLLASASAKTIEAAKKRLHRNMLAIALANKLARIAWSVLVRGRAFEASKLQAA